MKRSNSKTQKNSQPAPSETKKIQNLKDFKLQIDHQIAKCLDTLDRQGLKYLRETMKTSIIFDLPDNNYDHPQQYQHPTVSATETHTKSGRQQVKQESSGKSKDKAVNMDNNQKPSNKRPNDKKGSSALKSKAQAQQQQEMNHYEIEQQILQQYEVDLDEVAAGDEMGDKSATRIGYNSSKPILEEVPQPVKISSNKYKPEQSIAEPIRPFSKKVKRQSQKIISYESKDESYGQKELDVIVQRISKLPQDKFRQLGMIIQRLEKAHDEGNSSYRPYIYNHSSSQVHSARGKTAGNKSRKHQKATSLYSPIMKNKKRENDAKKNDEKEDPSRSYNVKGQEQEIEEQEIIEELNERHELQPSQQLSLRESVPEPVTQMSQTIKSSVLQKQKTSFKKSSIFKKLSTGNKPLDIDITESHQIDTVDLDQLNRKKIKKETDTEESMSHSGNSNSKMMKIGKKKLGSNLLEIILLKNRGHPNIIGLTGIEIYNMNRTKVSLSAGNIISHSSSKIMKLFNGQNLTIDQNNMYTGMISSDSSHRIELDIPQKIGGIKVWNYNKSEIESNKQTDQLQIIINSKIVWSGSLKKGSYNELNDFATEIVLDNGFNFCIPEEEEVTNSLKTSKMGQSPEKAQIKDEDKVAQWLQNTVVVEQKLKELQCDKNQKEQRNANRRSNMNLILPQKNTIANQSSIGISQIGFQAHRAQRKGNQQIETSQKQIQQLPKSNSRTEHTKLLPKKKLQETKSDKIANQLDIFNSLIKTTQLPNQLIQGQQQKQMKKQEPIPTKDLQIEIGNNDKQISANHPKVDIPKIKTHQKSLDDFMNDSLFQEPAKPIHKNKSKPKFEPRQDLNPPKFEIMPPQKDDLNLSKFINELDQLVSDGNTKNKYKHGNEGKKEIKIPEFPKGNQIELVIDSNWGDMQCVGFCKIQFFDQKGFKIFPSNIPNVKQLQQCLIPGSIPITSLFTNNQGNKSQLIFKKEALSIKIKLQFNKTTEFSLIRIGNYYGDRINTSKGLRKVKIFLDSCLIFSGEIRRSSGNSHSDIHNYESILFTNNKMTHKRIWENDWLYNELKNKETGIKDERNLFEKTLKGFHRPDTNGGASNQQIKIIQTERPIKIPKRQCFQFDPPVFPSGYHLKLVLHSSWGDRDFIGLNGIVLFDAKGNRINVDTMKIKQFPYGLASLPGYEKDMRKPENLLNDNYFSDKQADTWLAPLTSDIEKMNKKLPNTLLIELPGCCTISAINIYNYTKNSQRGVRELEVFMDYSCIYRGYIRKTDIQLIEKKGEAETHTSIGFTKDAEILQKIGFMGYHEDNLEQQVVFINQNKIMPS